MVVSESNWSVVGRINGVQQVVRDRGGCHEQATSVLVDTTVDPWATDDDSSMGSKEALSKDGDGSDVGVVDFATVGGGVLGFEPTGGGVVAFDLSLDVLSAASGGDIDLAFCGVDSSS